MDPSDLVFWAFDDALALVPTHHKWTGMITFSRRYKLRGFPDLKSRPVVAFGKLEISTDGAIASVRIVHRNGDDEGRKIGLTIAQLLESESRLLLDQTISEGDSLGPRWEGVEFRWTLSRPSRVELECELELMEGVFAAVRRSSTGVESTVGKPLSDGMGFSTPPRMESGDREVAMRPNLFSYATSELSQDAFLCWLLSWSDASHRDEDGALHALGVSLLGAIFRASGIPPPPFPCKVEVRRQEEDMDIVVLVGSDHVLAIEDKVHSSEHSDQLPRYLKAITRKYPKHKAVPVYVKTGDQSSFAAVEKAGWRPFRRRDLLSVLRGGASLPPNAIVQDFTAHLESIDAVAESFRTKPAKDWQDVDDRRPWEGLFSALQIALRDGEWGEVSNPRGGFVGFWWGWNSVRGGKLYLQLEEKKLVVKVESDSEDPDARAALRDRWSDRVVASAGIKFERPARFGNGQWMTVAEHGKWWTLGPTGIIDLDATLLFLRKATSEVKAIAAQR